MLRTSLRVVTDFTELGRRLVVKRRRVLFRVGPYGLRVLRSRIKSRKKTSPPHGPPFGKSKRLKRASSFEVDEADGRVDIGFFRFDSARAAPLGGKTVPDTIDQGGRERLDTPARVITRPDGRPRDIAPQSVLVNYAPRPLIEPARPTVEQKLREFAESTPL